MTNSFDFWEGKTARKGDGKIIDVQNPGQSGSPNRGAATIGALCALFFTAFYGKIKATRWAGGL